MMRLCETGKFDRSNSGLRLALPVIAMLLVVAGCSKLKNDNTTATTEGGGHSESTPSAATPAASAPAASEPGKPTPWEANADSLNGKEGETMTLACSPNGTLHNVWGGDIYTADSSICSAAVHSGLITLQQGGTVTIELRAGRSIYGASERNGVTSQTYGSWPHSFVFKTPNTEALVRAADEATPVLWNTGAAIGTFEAGKTLKVTCPANGNPGSVWGTDTYTLDSSICTAAVHAGKIKLEAGGPVTIEMRPGEDSYKGSERNGIKSNDYEKYGSSFVVK
jgi:hypothetical protein